jgi:hypothetical protein
MNRLTRLVGAAIVSSYLLVALAGPALAECDGPIPDFRVVVRSAERVFIGDVTATDNPGPDGFSERFTILVRYVLRGRVHRWPMTIRDLRGSPCSGNIAVTKGQRVALALDGTGLVGGQPATINSVAYITGNAPSWWDWSDPHIRADDIYRLAGVPLATSDVAPPNTSTTDPGQAVRTSQGSSLLFAILGFAVALALALWRLPSPHSDHSRDTFIRSSTEAPPT